MEQSGTSLAISSSQDFMLPMQGTCVQSLVGELDAHARTKT